MGIGRSCRPRHIRLHARHAPTAREPSYVRKPFCGLDFLPEAPQLAHVSVQSVGERSPPREERCSESTSSMRVGTGVAPQEAPLLLPAFISNMRRACISYTIGMIALTGSTHLPGDKGHRGRVQLLRVSMGSRGWTSASERQAVSQGQVKAVQIIALSVSSSSGRPHETTPRVQVP